MKKHVIIFLTILLPFNVEASEKPSIEDVIEYFEITNTIKLLEGYTKSYTDVLKDGYPDLDNRFYSDPE